MKPTDEKIKVEKHPGPFSGPDAELARSCAMAVIEWYGADDPITMERIRKNGIWNDHIAVQSALAAIHHLKGSPESSRAACCAGGYRIWVEDTSLARCTPCSVPSRSWKVVAL